MNILFSSSAALLISILFLACGKQPTLNPGKVFGEQITQDDSRKAIQIAGGLMHVCALSDNGQVDCWGHDNENQLSLQSATNASKEQYDLRNAAFSQISTGNFHSCGLLKGGKTDGLPFCFGKSGPWLDVPNEKMKAIYAGYNLTCFLNEEDHLGCVGARMRPFGSGSAADIDPAQLVKKYGIDPISGNGGQDFSTKQFRTVRFDQHWANICAQEKNTNKILCMGQNNYPNVTGLYSIEALDFYLSRQLKGYISEIGELNFVGAGFGFHPAINLEKPEKLKFKAIIAATASYGQDVFIAAQGNVYDNGETLPEGTIVVSSSPKTLLFESALGYVEGLGSTRASGNFYRCLLMKDGKVSCEYFEDRQVADNPISNVPAALKKK